MTADLNGSGREKQAYTIRHTALLAYKHNDITKLELEALLDKLTNQIVARTLEDVVAGFPPEQHPMDGDLQVTLNRIDSWNNCRDDCLAAVDAARKHV